MARFARVYPVYALSLLIALPFTLMWLYQKKALGVFPELVALQAPLLQAWRKDILYFGNWNTPSWSLSVEAFFYLCFPWLGAWVGRCSHKAVAATLWGLLGAAMLMWLTYWRIDPDGLHGGLPDSNTHHWAGVLYYNPMVRCIEFLFGVCMARLTLRADPDVQMRWPAFKWLLPASLIGLLTIFSFPESARNLVLLYPASVGLFGCLITGLAYWKPRGLFVWLSWPLMVLVGEASYGMYMLQRPVAGWVDLILVRNSWPSIESSWTGLLAFVLFLTAVSVASLKLIEVPARRMIRSRLKS